MKRTILAFLFVFSVSAGTHAQKPAMMFGDTIRLGRPFAKDPHVIFFSGHYLMYYSVPGFTGKEDIAQGWGIGIAESSDLTNWKKIGEVNSDPEATYEAKGFAAPCALVIDGKVNLFYQTYGTGKNDGICHAWSTDGIHFIRNKTNPIFHPDGNWNCGRAIDAEVIRFRGKYFLYYATRDTAFKIQMQGVAVAPGNTGFDRADWKNLSSEGPILKPEMPWERDCIEGASVIQKNDELFMFYAGAYNNAPQQIGVARSTDGIHWERISDQPFLLNGKPGEWNSSESGHPHIFTSPAGDDYLFYQGNNDNGKTWYISNIRINWVNGVPVKEKPFSGIYPNLAYYNNEGECGTGAVVPWADKLYVITYGPHLPLGSSDKLYEITADLKQTTHPESIGGTPANRMIHRESNQLFIGPYVIDGKGKVKVIPYDMMPGRLTGNARHLTDPAGKIYFATMEEGFYEVDVKTLEPHMIYKDGNIDPKPGQMVQYAELLPGAHGKGLYSGQGVMVYSNNGEASQEALKLFDIKAGVLAEWNGKVWKVVRRNQFTEVTGPGGIYGNAHPETDPIWATGWDFKSLLLGIRNPETGWSFYRLPKASHSYDGAHGWNTEWPRISNVGTTEKPDYLMTMHGMFWRFPATFTAANSAGIRPRSAYLKVIGDFTRWNNQLVFGCDDAAKNEFLNKRKVKGGIEGPGQSNSNLWFTSPEKADQLGPNTAEGAVWISEEITAGAISEPFLFAGWDFRSAWIKNEGKQAVSFTFEVDQNGDNSWRTLKTVTAKPGESAEVPFIADETGEWVRVIVDKATKTTVHFSYAQKDKRLVAADPMFAGLAPVTEPETNAGLLWGMGNNRRKLGVLSGTASDKNFTENGYYELDSLMNLVKKEDAETAKFIREKFAIPQNVITIDDASVLITDESGRRWRLPKGNAKYTDLTNNSVLRICREVATERDLLSCSGTFYELPAENADGFAKIRPIASHNFRIFDYASYRGMLIMTGIDAKSVNSNQHVIISNDGKASVWAGVIDDLWQMGKPVGEGGPWKNSSVKAGVASDPYLIGFYDERSLELSHHSKKTITFKIEVEPIGHGPWMTYQEVTVEQGETFKYSFPDTFQSRWIRFIADKDCKATTWLKYE